MMIDETVAPHELRIIFWLSQKEPHNMALFVLGSFNG
jgi:hypothetical protein